MSAKDQTITLSAEQLHAIASLGIDAWYLTPLNETPEKQQSDAAHHALIDHLLEDINAQPSAPSRPTHTKSPTASVNSANHEAPAINDNPSATPEQSRQSPVAVDTIIHAMNIASAPDETPTAINQSLTTDLPTNQQLPFPATPSHIGSASASQTLSWEMINSQLAQLAEQQHNHQPHSPTNSAQSNQQYSQKYRVFHGIGSQQAEDFFIFSPPEPQRTNLSPNNNTTVMPLDISDREVHLLTEMLASIAIEWQASYATAIFKHAIPYGSQPDSAQYDAHLRLLADEIALVQPKRLWLLGSLPCQTILQTQAPPAKIIQKQPRYIVNYTDAHGESRPAEVICLPPPDYLLALPSEKGRVWQVLKSLRANL